MIANCTRVELSSVLIFHNESLDNPLTNAPVVVLPSDNDSFDYKKRTVKTMFLFIFNSLPVPRRLRSIVWINSLISSFPCPKEKVRKEV